MELVDSDGEFIWEDQHEDVECANTTQGEQIQLPEGLFPDNPTPPAVNQKEPPQR